MWRSIQIISAGITFGIILDNILNYLSVWYALLWPFIAALILLVAVVIPGIVEAKKFRRRR